MVHMLQQAVHIIENSKRFAITTEGDQEKQVLKRKRKEI